MKNNKGPGLKVKFIGLLEYGSVIMKEEYGIGDNHFIKALPHSLNTKAKKGRIPKKYS